MAKGKLVLVVVGDVDESQLPIHKEELSNERHFAKAPRTYALGLSRCWTKK